MPESETFSRLLEQETQKWIDEEISKGNDAWNARRSFDGLSNIHWDMVAQSAAQIQEHLAGSGQNMTQGIFLCRCIQKHRPELLQKSDGTPAQTTDLVNCKPEELQPWPSATIKIVAKNLKRLCLAELGCENPGTAWDSILKRDVAYRRAGNRQEAYHIAFLLNMTTEEMQCYFFLTRQEAFSLRDPLDIVCFAFKFFDAKKDHADSFHWWDVTDVLQGYLTACKTADAAAEHPVRHCSQKNGSTRILSRDVQKLQNAMHRTNNPAVDIPALRHDLQEYLLAHRRNLTEMKLELVHPKKLPPSQSRVEICMGYPYSHTVQRELSILVGYLLVLYGRWNTVVKTVYPKKEQERRDKLLLSSEKGAAPKLLSADDFMAVLSQARRETLEPLKEAFQEKLDPDSFQVPPSAAIKPRETAFLMGQWLLRITPQESASPDDFKTAVQPLNDFLLQVEAIKESDIPKLTYPGSARLTCNVIWHLAGCLHCKRALSARIADGPKAAHPSASEWADYFHKLGNALVEVSADEEHFKDRERCGILNKDQHSGLQAVLTSVSTYDSCRDSCSESNSEAKRYRHIQDHLEMGLPNLCYKIEATLHDYSPKAEKYAARIEPPNEKELDCWQANNALGSRLLSREDILQLFFFLILAIYDCCTADAGKAQEAFTAEHAWLKAMRDKAEAKLKEPGGTTGSFLEDALFASVFVELEGLWNEPKSDTVTPDQTSTIRRIYNFLMESLTLASGTTWHSIYYPAYADRFYVLAGALATAVPQSRRTLGLMMGVHRQKRPKPADKKKGSAKGSRAAPKS
ncbi:MAG: hypothetical protein UC771_02855 [Faecalibacterium sp.]|nr:hypothetical protein [Faecalibacterium sp.]